MTVKKDFYKQFLFGDTVVSGEPLSVSDAAKLLAKGKAIKDKAVVPSQDEILAVFSPLSKAWADPNYQKRRDALDALSENSDLGGEFIKVVLGEFAKILTPEYLLRKIEGELGSSHMQGMCADHRQENIQLIVQPAGAVLHVASGNVFIACIESLINGIITRNINFLKMSTDDRDFPALFAESIREFDREGIISRRLAVVWWPGGDAAVEDLFKQRMDRIIFWGGGEALKSWERNLGESAALVRHGPKVSFGIVSREGLKGSDPANLTDNIALDIAIWEQKACNCPQMLFLEGSIPDAEVKRFVDSLTGSMKSLSAVFPPGRRSNDEYVEVLKARELAMAKHFITGEPISVRGPETFEWTIIFEEQEREPKFELSPLNRTIIIKRYPSLAAFTDLLKERSFYLQTAGYCLGDSEIQEYAVKLSGLGVTRLCRFGVMAIPAAGVPHDGSFALLDLTRFTVVER